jgi:formate dehydrogenase gamma subunit
MSENVDTYTRFDLSQRIQHIVLITSFTMLALTGLPQIFFGAKWAQAILSVLGGLDVTRMVHHFFGVLLVAIFLYHIIIALINLIFERSRAMLPRLQDAKDIVQSIGYLQGRHTEQPQYDRFDFRQKVEYWALIWGTLLMGATGLILMFPLFVARYLPGVVIYAAKAAHGLEAFLAVASIIIWHMYNTHFAGGRLHVDTTIFTGKISKQRMMEEHPLEYQRLINESSQVLSDTSAEEV